MQFSKLCEFFEQVKSANDASSKNVIVQQHLAEFRQVVDFTSQKNYEAFYGILRLILPKSDRERQAYRLKESKISRLLIRMFNLPPDDTVSLTNACNNTDFASIAHHVIRKYITDKKTTLTIAELNATLDSIANRESDTHLDALVLQLFRKCSPDEIKWAIRIILRDLKLGFQAKRILTLFHPDASAYFDTNNNLKKVCETLWSPHVKLHELEINLFEPFKPMLSKRCVTDRFTIDFPADKTFFIENKFDGERFQLHMGQGGKFMYFSRNGFDFSEKYGVDFTQGLLTPKLKNVFAENVQQLILDGEMMLWNKKTGSFGSKGMTYDVKKLLHDSPFQPCFCVYDILLVNDEVLTNVPLSKRLKTLKRVVVNEIPGVITLSKITVSRSQGDIVKAINDTMELEEEGIIVKDPASIYKCSNRNGGWFKIKMEYFDNSVHDLDLVVMGGYYGSTSSKIGSYIVGIVSKNNNQTTYLSFAKIGTGLNFDETNDLTAKIKEKGHSMASFGALSSGALQFGKEVPDIWLEPTSLFFKVRASELIRCTDQSFRTPFTLRFPRILKIRDDKSLVECCTIDELLELTKQNKSVIKLNKRHLELEEILSAKKKPKKARTILNVEDLTKTGDFLEGLRFYVLSGTEEWPKNKVESMIRQCGGQFTLRINDQLDAILVGSPDKTLESLLQKEHKYDIVDLKWLLRIIEQKTLLRYGQNDVISIGNRRENYFNFDVDLYGDSFSEDTSIESLKRTFGFMTQKGQFSEVDCNKINLIENRYDGNVAYFDKYEIINELDSKMIYNSFLDEIEFKFQKGTILEKLDSNVNLIVTHDLINRKPVLIKFLELIENNEICRIISSNDILKNNT